MVHVLGHYCECGTFIKFSCHLQININLHVSLNHLIFSNVNAEMCIFRPGQNKNAQAPPAHLS